MVSSIQKERGNSRGLIAKLRTSPRRDWNLMVTELQPEKAKQFAVRHQVLFQVGCLEALPKLSYLPSLTIVQAGGSNMAIGEDL